MTVLSILLGAVLGMGLALVVRAMPVGWRPTLLSRVQPQLKGHVPTSSLMDVSSTNTWGTLGRLVRPLLDGAIRKLDRFNPAERTLQRRLNAAGLSITVSDYRAQQVVFALGGALIGVLLTIVLAFQTSFNVFWGLLLVIGLALVCFYLRDNLLTTQIKNRQTRILAEFPTVSELFALSVSAGDTALGAVERVAKTMKGDLPIEFAAVIAEVHAGSSITVALRECAGRIQLAPVERFISGVIVALERGTPLADVLRAQAQDVRELSKRELMESAGKKEIAMMAPIVFGLLPLTVVFAVFPGLSLLNIGL